MSADGFIPGDMWATLDLSPTEDRTAIRRAYARQLKVTNPEDDAAGFTALRAAYEAALLYADANASEAFLSDDTPEKSDKEKTKPARLVRPNPKHMALGDLDRQAPPSPLVVEFASALAEAQARLQGGLDRSAPDADLLSALNAILSSPLLDRREDMRAAEAWLTLLIVDNRPHSDILIPAIVARFDWSVTDLEKRDLDAEQRSMRQWICRRGRDLRFLHTLQNSDYDYHDAYRVLSQPPGRATLRDLYFPPISDKQIAEFLNRVRRYQPTIEDDLNPRTVAQWDRRLSMPILPILTLWVSTAATVCLIVMVAGWFILPPEAAAGATIFLGLPVLWAGIQLVRIYVIARPRARWIRNGRDQVNPALAYGWGPLLLLLLLLAPVPASTGSIWLIVVLSLFVSWWVAITGDAHERATQWPWFMRLAFGEAPLGIFWLLSARGLPAGTFWQMAMVFTAISFVSCFGQQPLLRLWEGLKLPTQRLGQTAAALISLGAIAWLWFSYSDTNLHPLCFSAISGAVLLHRVPAMITDRRFALIRRTTLSAGIFVVATISDSAMALPILGTLVLAWAVLNCIVAWSDTR